MPVWGTVHGVDPRGNTDSSVLYARRCAGAVPVPVLCVVCVVPSVRGGGRVVMGAAICWL